MIDFDVLHKYLDVDGGLSMLKLSNLQFTNATKLNDPLDCHPSLINYSNANNRDALVWGKRIVEEVEINHAENCRDTTWICSLSKVNDSLLMWSYYNRHEGVCIGLNRKKTKECLSHILNGVNIGAQEMEVQYKEIVEKPDYFHDYQDFFTYQFSTKAKDWAHEQEVRILLTNPTPSIVPHNPNLVIMALPPKHKRGQKYVDRKELRAYAELCGDCFESVYLGVNMDDTNRQKIIKAAKNCNPNIIIYQMTIDPDAFRLKAKRIV